MIMKINKMHVVCIALLFVVYTHQALANPSKMPVASVAPATVTPIQAIQDLDKIADQYRVGKNLTAEDKAFNRQLKESILRGTFDLKELAKLALAQYWNQIGPKEQKHFVDLLTNLLEERSVFSKEKAVEKGHSKGYTISYTSQIYLNKEKTDVMVKSVIRLNKKRMKVGLDYKLKLENGIWKIYDVIMDDASLVDNYRYSFGNIIRKNGYPDLVRRMENKLKEFKTKNS